MSKTLLDRINESMERVGKMCSEGRPPRMSIPVNPDDDDTFINDTLRECRAVLAAPADAPREMTGRCSAHLHGQDPTCETCYPQPDHVSQGSAAFCQICGQGWDSDLDRSCPDCGKQVPNPNWYGVRQAGVPEGPYVHGEIVEGRMCSVWHKDECSRDSVFMGSGEQAIGVCNELNRLNAKEKTNG